MIPTDLTERRQWVCWKTVPRGGTPTKLPFQPSGQPASSTDPATWSTYEEAATAPGYDGPGYVFAADDPFCGIDLDGCRDPQTGAVAEWARAIIKRLNSYSEVSPSGSGVKMWVRAKSPFDTGKNFKLAHPPLGGKNPGIEVYDHGRYFAVTGQHLAGVAQTPQERDLTFLREFTPPPLPLPAPGRAAPCDVVERAKRYVRTMPEAVSGDGGHNAAYKVACRLVCGFGLTREQAFDVMAGEYNQRCRPPWNEKELLHKIGDAANAEGPRNYLRDASDAEMHSVKCPEYTLPKKAAVTLEQTANRYVSRMSEGSEELIRLGLPEVDDAMGGGFALGEIVLIAGRPGHGKSAVALQCIHYVTGRGIPALIISEEMNLTKIGKKTVQFISHVPHRDWRQSPDEVSGHLASHFRGRAPCYVVENVRTVERAVEEIREHVREHGVQAVVVDYAQLLQAQGRGRYEQVTNVSIALRQVTNECNVLTIVLCQLSRSVESRHERKGAKQKVSEKHNWLARFCPQMSDLKDSGQLEQDADCILFVVYPHKSDPEMPSQQFLFFPNKNRNRETNAPVVTCLFDGDRQMVKAQATPEQEAQAATFSDFNTRDDEPF